jgi:DNA-binding NarL/FixJ family response regulator
MTQQSNLMKLNGRQAQVCLAVAEGGSAPSIARALGTTPGTVRNLISEIYAALGISSRAEIGGIVARNLTYLRAVANNAKPAANRKEPR